MEIFVVLYTVFILFCGKTDAMFLQSDDSQGTLIDEDNKSIELIGHINNPLNLREISLFDDDIEAIKACVERGDDVNMVKIGITPLVNAIVNGSDAIALHLLDHGADPSQETRYGFPLDLAIRNKRGDVARALIIKRAYSSDIFNDGFEIIDDTTTSTEISLFDDDIESVKACVERGDDINMVKLGTTPLANAIVSNSDAIVLYLLDQGADPNQETKYGFPLDLAMKKKNSVITKALIRNGANSFNVFNVIDVEGQMSKL